MHHIHAASCCLQQKETKNFPCANDPMTLQWQFSGLELEKTQYS